MREVSHKLLDKLIHYDPARAMAFIAIDEQSQKMMGVVRLQVLERCCTGTTSIPPGGIPAGPRNGPMYAMLEREAKEAGLRWPARLPNTRRALAAAEWARRHQPRAFPLRRSLFGRDFEDKLAAAASRW
jgi:hypothetical protein